jgi:hypothetical protein
MHHDGINGNKSNRGDNAAPPSTKPKTSAGEQSKSADNDSEQPQTASRRDKQKLIFLSKMNEKFFASKDGHP